MEEIINPNVSNSNSNLVNAKEELQVGMSNLSEQLTEYLVVQDYEFLPDFLPCSVECQIYE